MFLRLTIILSLLFFTAASCSANGDPLPGKEIDSPGTSKKIIRKRAGVSYTFHLDNTINKNNTIDSVLVILDKFDLSGAGVVKKIFYPNAENQIVIEGLALGKYYADVYVLGVYKKHFSAVIRTAKSAKRNKAKLQLDFKGTYTPGSVSIPGENLSLFAFHKN